MKTNLLPALIMLTAGAIDCVISFAERTKPFKFTVRLLAVLVIFYVLGCVIKWIIDANFQPMEEEEAAEGEEVPEEGVTEMDAEARNMSEEELENINADNSVE